MTLATKPTLASQQYATAYAAHYTIKNLRQAIEHYQGVIAQYPDSPEAGYSRTQILNIARSVVCQDALLEARVRLIRSELSGARDGDVVDVTLTEALP